MTNIVRNPEDEIINYIDAYEIQQAEVPTDMLTTKQRRFNPLTNENDLLMRMPNGGYVKVGSEPLAMTEAPKQPELPAADELPTGGLGPQVESLQLYVQNNLGGKYDMKDLEAAGYSPEVIKAAGLDVQPKPMFAPKPQEDPENPEPLSEQETANIIASGQPIITVNPSLRDKASQSFVNFLYETAIEGLKDDLREQGLGQEEIDRMVADQQDDLFKNAEIYSNALFGTGPTGMEVGAADFLTAGIMDIEEGRRLFNQQRPENNGSLGGRVVGALIMAAGVAEATGVGYGFGKLLKRGAKALEPTLVRMGNEFNQPAQSPTIRAFHGSGADFDKFDLSFMGTGEGAQAYGKGLYFAEMEEVAQDYRQKLSGVLSNPLEDVLIPADASPAAMAKADNDLKQAVAFASVSFSPEGAARDFAAFTGREESPELIEAFRQAMSNKGRLYEVKINADPNELMNFDALISDQPEKVQKVLAPFVKRRLDEIEAVGREEVAKAKAEGREFTPRTRDEILSTLKGGDILLLDKVVTGEVSQALKDAGIPGIRYLDQNSRNKSFEVKLSVDGQPYATEPIFATTRAEANQIVNDYKDKGFDATVTNVGSSNYVVLDDNLIDIVKKYGFGGLMVGAGVQSSLGVKESFEEA